jgi:hypothetical protein
MLNSISNSEKIAQIFTNYCADKNYQIRQTEEANNLRLDISNLSERTIVNIYHTGKILVQGKPNKLRTEIESIKNKIAEEPQSFPIGEAKKIKSCTAKYDIMLSDLRREIKESLTKILVNYNLTENPKLHVEYILKVQRGAYSITVSQYRNGTLLLQGKTDRLFDECCDQVEKIANPSEEQVISRFISSDEKVLESFTSKYTIDLIQTAEGNVRAKLKSAYDYLESYDQKWFVASECLRISKIPLPEFSSLVMPASKAFEGFIKKVLVEIGLFEPEHFRTKKGNFAGLSDPNNPKRKAICIKEKYAESMLDRIRTCLDVNRNFMMHSDESRVTRVNTYEEAESKIDKIYHDSREIFDYFDNLYKLS